jgi:Domain of unknown function (DUF4234)
MVSRLVRGRRRTGREGLPPTRWSGRWRWYRSRLGGSALLLAAGGATFAVAALSPHEAWYDVATPSPGAGLTRIAESWPGGFFVRGPTRPAPRDVRDSVLVAADGTPALGERLLRYSGADRAEAALRDVLRRNGARRVVPHRGLYEFAAGCATTCRPAAVGRDDDVVIVIARVGPATSDEAFAKVERRYAEEVGAFDWDFAWRPYDILLILAVVAFFYLPIVARHTWVTRRAQRTPHVHQPGTPLPPEVVDVCDAAGEARRLAHALLAVEWGIFAACAVLMAMYVWFMLAAMLAAPLVWFVERRASGRRSRAASRPGASRLDRRRVGVVRSVRVRVEIVAAQAAAVGATVTAWMLGFIGIVLVAAVAQAVMAQSAPTDLFGGPQPFVEIAVAAAWFLFVAALGLASTTSRFARRMRLVAADRTQEHGRRPSVLYLRTFDDDHRLVAAGGPAGLAANEIFTLRARVPYEEIVARELDRHGVVAAIAEPNAPRLFLPLGATRKRLSDDDWRDGVLMRMDDAALVVIAIGSTAGLLWELEAATRNGHLDRVLLVVPPDDDDRIEARWKATMEAIAAAGGPTIHAPVSPAEILVARLSKNGLREVVVADRRDEFSYVAALDRALLVPDDQLEPEPAAAARDAGALGQPRDIALAIVLIFLTFGLYGLYWLYTTHEEMKRHTGAGVGGEIGLATGVLTFGISTGFVLPREVAAMYARAGRQSPVDLATGLWLVPGAVLIFTPFVWFAKVQHALNTYWDSQGAATPVTLDSLLRRLASASSLRSARWIGIARSRLPASVANSAPSAWLAKLQGTLDSYSEANRGGRVVSFGSRGSPRGIGFGIALFLLTFGAYGFYWVYKTHDEIKRHTGDGLGGLVGVVVWVFTVSIATAFVIPAEIARMYTRAGEPSPVTHATGLLLVPGGLLYAPALLWFVRVQQALNRYWTEHA